MKKSFIITSMAAFAALCFSLTAQAQGPVVVSDKDDYAPGETALFQAAGFQPNELLDFSVAVQGDDGTWVPDIAWADVPADASGGAEVEYVVPESWADKTLQLTVMGLTSGLMATTTFTDAAAATATFSTSGLPAGTSVSVPWSGFSNGSGNPPVSGTQTFSSPGPSIAVGGLLAGSQFTFTFPATVTGSDMNQYDFVSASPASPVTLAGSPSHNPITGTYTLHVETNTPPTITCLDPTADLGQAYGCLGTGTGFGQTFSVSYSVVAAPSPAPANEKIVQATFTKALPGSGTVTVDVAKVDDTDGDTITVTLSLGTNPVTISGPGNGFAMFSVHIIANDGHNPDVVSNPDCGGTANAQIIYEFNGFFPPLSNLVNTKVKQGSTVPVKFQVTDCSGNVISTSSDTISVAFQSGSAPDGDPTVDDAGASNDNGIYFRWDPTGMQDIFNLKTDSMYYVGNTYKITATLDDGTTHDVYICIKH